MSLLQRPDLCLKSCLEIYKITCFSLNEFLIARRDCIEGLLRQKKNEDFNGKMTILREHLPNMFRQALTIFSDSSSQEKVIEFMNNWFMRDLIMRLRKTLKNSPPMDRNELTQLWHSTRLAGSVLNYYSYDFSELFEDIFVEKTFEMIARSFNERIRAIETTSSIIPESVVIDIQQQYDLDATVLLNCVVDVINHVRLCPESKQLSFKIQNDLFKVNDLLPESVKHFAIKELNL